MNTVPIAFAFDNNWVMPACVCISSLLMNAQKDTFYDIFILHSCKVSLEKELLDRIPEYYSNCRIQYRAVDGTFDTAFEIRGITTSTYYRLLIPKLIPEYHKIVYSDVDVIFRSDLWSVFSETDLTDCYIAGVNSLSHLIPENVSYYNKLGISSKDIIYAGNLIMNTQKILEDNVIDKILALSQNKYKFQDMDILNIVCRGKIKYLTPDFCLTTYFSKWNIYNHQALNEFWDDEIIKRALDIGIVHYNGHKPWKEYCVNFDIWWWYYRHSPFFDEKFYFDFYWNHLSDLDQLSLWKRIKILIRYFVYGKRRL